MLFRKGYDFMMRFYTEGSIGERKVLRGMPSLLGSCGKDLPEPQAPRASRPGFRLQLLLL